MNIKFSPLEIFLFPLTAAFVAEHVPPATTASLRTIRVEQEGVGASSGDDDEAAVFKGWGNSAYRVTAHMVCPAEGWVSGVQTLAQLLISSFILAPAQTQTLQWQF